MLGVQDNQIDNPIVVVTIPGSVVDNKKNAGYVGGCCAFHALPEPERQGRCGSEGTVAFTWPCVKGGPRLGRVLVCVRLGIKWRSYE